MAFRDPDIKNQLNKQIIKVLRKQKITITTNSK